LQSSLREVIGKAFTGEIAVRSKSDNGGILPTTLARDLATLDQVDGVAGLGGALYFQTGDDGTRKGKQTIVTDPVEFAKVYHLDFDQGGWDGLGGNSVIVSQEYADKDGLSLGSPIPITQLNGIELTLSVGGIFAEETFGDMIADRAA
ncbi:MAG TPA: hypothetical protein PLV68_17705, partial [Ilumatobacteraceae bacterium]|nr:hypothetical protein [Ilumatobacteraceae bacterium]